jgi:hypothetical protein
MHMIFLFPVVRLTKAATSHRKNLYNYKLRTLRTSSALLKKNFKTSADILCTNVKVSNNLSMFLCMLYWRTVTPWRWSRYIETCRDYDKLVGSFCCLNYYTKLYSFFWVIPRSLNFVPTCFETPPQNSDAGQSPKKKACNIQNTAKILAQEYYYLISRNWSDCKKT